ncbi:MAG: T9SS type A sorting domain-containing protein [Chitinophagales bacterium]|nr:T9SS type A sorting domain-containing protein [Chitinophagales bacterium]
MRNVTLMALLFGCLHIQAQTCATIGYQSNPNSNAGDLFYADNFFGDTANTIFTWSFCSGVTTTGISVNYPMLIGGMFLNNCEVCLTVTDSITNNVLCIVCDTINVSGNPTGNCAAYATYTNVDSFYTFFVSTTGGSPVQYEWFVNNVLYDTTASVSLVLDSLNYVNAGALVCVYVLDASGCMASDCIILDSDSSNPSGWGSVPCQAYFVIYPPDTTNGSNTVGGLPGYYWGYNLSSGNYGNNVLWDFGDGTTSTDPYPAHTYANPGTYIVCLTVGVVGTSCYDTYCDSSFYVFKTEGQPMSQLTILAPTGVNELAPVKLIAVYPNPAETELQWTPDNRVEQVKVFNAFGQKAIDAVNVSDKLNISGLASGIYIIKLCDRHGKIVAMQRFVKQ